MTKAVIEAECAGLSGGEQGARSAGVAGGGKLLELESLRGLAAFAVVLYHILQFFYPAIFLYPLREKGHWALQCLSMTPLKVMYCGTLAVELFFVLSGFALSYSFFRRGEWRVLVAGAARRYVRLAPPILGAVLLMYGLMRMGWVFGADVAALMPGNIFGILFRFPPSLSGALVQGTTTVFVTPPLEGAYNPALWTMRPEFMGSMLVYGLLACAGRFRARWLVYGPLLVAAGWWMAPLVNFLFGVVLCDVYVNWAGLRTRGGWAWRAGAALLFSGAVYVGVYDCPGPFYPPGLFAVTTRWATGAAVVMIACVLASPDLSRMLVVRPLVWLGRVSFSLYLTHTPVLASAAAYGYCTARQGLGWGETGSVLLAAGIGVAGALLVAWAFYWAVEAPTVRFAKWLGDGVVGRGKKKAGPA